MKLASQGERKAPRTGLKPGGASSWPERTASVLGVQAGDLPGRERELLCQVGQGCNALEISQRLGSRCDTVHRLSRVKSLGQPTSLSRNRW
jgi:hypothetical protein